MTRERLAELATRGWLLTRDGSTGTAFHAWEDPEDPESGWELMVLHTQGHPNRLSVDVSGEGLTERSLPEATSFAQAVAEAAELVDAWRGEVLEEGG